MSPELTYMQSGIAGLNTGEGKLSTLPSWLYLAAA